MLHRIAPQYRRRAILNLITLVVGIVGMTVAVFAGEVRIGIMMVAIGAVYIAGFALYRFATSHVRPKIGSWLLLGGLVAAELLVAVKFATQHRVGLGDLFGVGILVYATIFTQRSILFSSRGKTFGERLAETMAANREYRERTDQGPPSR